MQGQNVCCGCRPTEDKGPFNAIASEKNDILWQKRSECERSNANWDRSKRAVWTLSQMRTAIDLNCYWGYVHTVSFSLAFYIVLRPQGITKQIKTLRKRYRVHIAWEHFLKANWDRSKLPLRTLSEMRTEIDLNEPCSDWSKHFSMWIALFKSD